MRLEQLSAFIEVVKCGSINAAAKKLHTTHQGLNQSLTALENELNRPLLDRDRKGTHLTPEGEKVLRFAQEVCSQYAELQKELASADTISASRLRGRLDLRISPMLNLSILPIAFSEFHRCYPAVSVFTAESYREDIIQEIRQNKDCCGLLLVSPLLHGFYESIPDTIELIELKTFPIYIAVSPRHPLARHKTVSVSTLAQYPIIVYEVGGTQGVHALSQLAPIKVALSTNNARLCEDILGQGIATMYSFKPYLKHHIFSDFIHIPVNDKRAVFTVYAAINRDVPPGQYELIRTFINVFHAYL